MEIALYKPEKTPLDQFLEQTRAILHTLAHHAQEIATSTIKPKL